MGLLDIPAMRTKSRVGAILREPFVRSSRASQGLEQRPEYSVSSPHIDC